MSYVDFNLIDSAYFSFASELFYDSHHMNLYGAESFSRLFVDFIKGNIPENAFWGTVNERLDAEAPAFYGISFTDTYSYDDGGYIRTLSFIANHGDEIEYRVAKTPYLEESGAPEQEDEEQGQERKEQAHILGKEVVLRAFGTDTQVSLPVEEHGLLSVSYRVNAGKQTTLIYEY